MNSQFLICVYKYLILLRHVCVGFYALIYILLDSSDGITTGYGLGGWGSILGRERVFSYLCSSQIGSGAYPTAYQMGTGGKSAEP
jgi:hypothetical protein